MRGRVLGERNTPKSHIIAIKCQATFCMYVPYLAATYLGTIQYLRKWPARLWSYGWLSTMEYTPFSGMITCTDCSSECSHIVVLLLTTYRDTDPTSCERDIVIAFTTFSVPVQYRYRVCRYSYLRTTRH
jgi:hypothetical protein